MSDMCKSLRQIALQKAQACPERHVEHLCPTRWCKMLRRAPYISCGIQVKILPDGKIGQKYRLLPVYRVYTGARARSRGMAITSDC